MRNLIVCCDGTWNDPNNRDGDTPAPTNVRKLFDAVDLDGEDPVQLTRYQSGVGTGGIFDRVAGGLVGFGLSEDIRDCYQWLADKYQKGDRIFLFGFSRGAYTARSLGGLIGKFGLIDFKKHKGESRSELVRKLYCEGYKGQQACKDLHFHADSTSIHFIGVWDTVGALGVPDDKVILDLLDNASFYRFHDTKIGTHVRYARHAVALDEKRSSFTPTLWDKAPAGVDLKQLWFPGVHSDVGGGYKETGLSDGALKWMVDEASGAEGGIRFREAMIAQVNPNATDLMHDSYVGAMKVLQTVPRAFPDLEYNKAPLHESVRLRREVPPVNQGIYRRTRSFTNKKVEVDIYAKHHWYWTGVYLKKGQSYRFSADGEWIDGTIATAPAGASDGQFNIGELAHLAGSLLGSIEGAWRYLRKKDIADFVGTKRVEDADWFSLVGAIMCHQNPGKDGTPKSPPYISIGNGCEYEVTRSGYFYAFANDAWGFYDNNRGYVSLTIEQL